MYLELILVLRWTIWKHAGYLCVTVIYGVSTTVPPSSSWRKAESAYKLHWESPRNIYLWPERENGAVWLQSSTACHSVWVVAGPVLNLLCGVQRCNYKLVEFFLCLTREWIYHFSLISFPWHQVWPAPSRYKNYKTNVLNEHFGRREFI